MDHFRYCADLVGIEHVAFGPDTLYGDHVGLHRVFATCWAWPGRAPGPRSSGSQYVDGLENPTENFPNICGWLVAARVRRRRDPGRARRQHLRALQSIWVEPDDGGVRGRGRRRPGAGAAGRRVLPDRAHRRPAHRHPARRDRVRRPGARPQPGRRGARRGPDRRRSSSGWPASTPACSARPTGPATPCSAHLAWAARSDLEHGLWEANASAGGYVSPQAMVFQSVPTALLADAAAVDGYLQRLRGLAGVLRRRHRPLPAGQGRRPAPDPGRRRARPSTSSRGTWRKDIDGRRAGRRCACPVRCDEDAARARGGRDRGRRGPARDAAAAGLPAATSCCRCARPDDQVGIRFVPGGAEGYRAAVRRHTTTEPDPGGDPPDRPGLPGRPARRVGRAGRAGAGHQRGARDPGPAAGRPGAAVHRLRADRAPPSPTRWPGPRRPATTGSRPTTSRDCVIEEIDPVEAGNAPLAYYRPPAAGGQRPGAHCVLTAARRSGSPTSTRRWPSTRARRATTCRSPPTQTLAGLPDFRRFLDAEVCGYVEGWGLYCERLADEMGLYTSDLQRLGMLSFDALARVPAGGGHRHAPLRLVPLPRHRVHVGEHRHHPGQRDQRDGPVHRLARPGAGLHDRPPGDPPAARRRPSATWARGSTSGPSTGWCWATARSRSACWTSSSVSGRSRYFWGEPRHDREHQRQRPQRRGARATRTPRC